MEDFLSALLLGTFLLSLLVYTFTSINLQGWYTFNPGNTTGGDLYYVVHDNSFFNKIKPELEGEINKSPNTLRRKENNLHYPINFNFFTDTYVFYQKNSNDIYYPVMGMIQSSASNPCALYFNLTDVWNTNLLLCYDRKTHGLNKAISGESWFHDVVNGDITKQIKQQLPSYYVPYQFLTLPKSYFYLANFMYKYKDIEDSKYLAFNRSHNVFTHRQIVLKFIYTVTTSNLFITVQNQESHDVDPVLSVTTAIFLPYTEGKSVMILQGLNLDISVYKGKSSMVLGYLDSKEVPHVLLPLFNFTYEGV